MDAQDEIRFENATDVEVWRREENARASVSIIFGFSRSRAEVSVVGETISREGDDYFIAAFDGLSFEVFGVDGYFVADTAEGPTLQAFSSGPFRPASWSEPMRQASGAELRVLGETGVLIDVNPNPRGSAAFGPEFWGR